MNEIQAILIDSGAKTISKIRINSGDHEAIGKIIGSPFCLGSRFENGDFMLLDDEGLINGTESFFVLEGASQPFAGSALIFGKEDSEGNATNARSDLLEITRRIRFLSRETLSQDYLDYLCTPQILPMKDGDFEEFLTTGKIPGVQVFSGDVFNKGFSK